MDLGITDSNDRTCRGDDAAAARGVITARDPLEPGSLIAALRERLPGDEILAFGLAPDPDGASLAFLDATPAAAATRPALERLLRARPRSFDLFDPECPEPRQRNVALTHRDLVAWFGPATLPIACEALAAGGIPHADFVRALVCDGASMLAWVGAFRRTGAFAEEDRAAVQETLPLLKRRLVERRVRETVVTWAALAATLEEMGDACVLLREPGHVLLANAEARALLRASPRARLELHAALCGAAAGGWSVRRLKAPGLPDCALASRRDGLGRAHLPPTLAGQRWGLTRRQQDVLALAATGRSNKDIAAVLGCAERTVELHVSACLGKARCASRAELVAKVWR